ncbi:MAG: cupin domain-containing protein [Polyangiales bacterium]|nr:cupin domain-containing protein [Myxococcales bacterium]MCB9658008.1 cupin domain-containing protein [Sandaracinaceae bacterium]
MNATYLDHDGAPGAESITPAELNAEGVYYATAPTDPAHYQGALDALMSERGYIEQDEVALSPSTPNLDALCAKFVGEHYHDDDEVRFVLEGEGIFDIRSLAGRFMRVVVEPGDLIVVPALRHHRFMLTDQKTIRCVRLFKDQSGWVPHYAEG